MFSNDEELSCETCGFSFFGRKPEDGGIVLCPMCTNYDELPLIGIHDDIPEEVITELIGGRGDLQ